MTLCKFYQQGNCRFGSNCRFEHPAPNNRNQPSRPFGSGGGGGTQQSSFEKYNISLETIEKDLTTERPLWILSAYAPGKGAPDQLFGGYPREQSFEELRLHYMAGKATGNEQQALNDAQQLYQNAEDQMKTALVNLKQAAQYVVDGENRHPNRVDICREGTQGAPFGEFAAGRRPLPGAQASNNPFGAPQTSSPFGQGGAAPQAPGFGQPSALGSRPNPFGSPAQFGQPAQLGPAAAGSPFSNPAQLTQQSPAFGTASSLGPKPSPFQQQTPGQTAQQGAQGGGFGQTSQLGARPNPFASQANPGASPFNPQGQQVNNNANANPFASNNNTDVSNPSPFAAAPNNAPQPSQFQSQGMNQDAAAPSPFAQPQQQQTNNPFGQAATPASGQNANNPFGQPQPQPQPQQGMGGFPNQPTVGNPFEQSKPSPFGPPANASLSTAVQPVPQHAQGATNSPYPPGSQREHPTLESYITRSMDGRIGSFKGRPVEYRNGRPGTKAFNGAWARIWFPDGPPICYQDTQLPLEKYDEQTKSQWAAFVQNGDFVGGLMPELPPPREVTSWDF